MKRNLRFWLLAAIRSFLAAVAIGYSLCRPPVVAQQSLTTTVMVNEERLREVDTHLSSTDDRLNKALDGITANLKSQWSDIKGLQQAQASQQGEERIISAVIGLLASAGLVIQIRKKP